MTTTVQVRPATDADAETLRRVLARAFTTDPVMSWIFRDDATRTDDLALLFTAAVRAYVPKGLSYTTEDLAGAALWTPPGEWQMPPEFIAEMGPLMTARFDGETISRLLEFVGAMDRAHPTAPHYYLACLATDAGRQGQGIGAANMRPVLSLADSEGVPCYLESSNERNVPLYERNGFETTQIVTIGDDGPPVWLMWRALR
jgi:ribosomal protein S18 acetylase RimI-like enzyme